jgi:hypothetical protein
MASDDIKKLVSEQMPGFEAVSPPKRTSRRIATPDQQSRPAADWKTKLEGNRAPLDATSGAQNPGGGRATTAKKRRDARTAQAPTPASSRDAFFGSGDPRERLRSRAANKYRRDGATQEDQKTIIVQVRPTDPPADGGRRAATTKAVVVKGKKIVGTQG